MPDYIYLLENRLPPAQQNAIRAIRDVAREAGMTVFLTGGAVRDLTSGSPVRDLDISVQGDVLDLKQKLVEAGAVIWGEHLPSQTIYARFPGSVRVEVSSTRREEFPKPGQPVYQPGSILEDLRRRDFTANAMALSLNDGSYGLLMDPLNGVADLEARILRLVSNYGFIEDPIRMVRAVRLRTRLGWELEEKTQVRFQNSKDEGMLEQISAYPRGYEVEEIVHEEDGLKILKVLEADGIMKVLFPAWLSTKADVDGLQSLRDVLVQLQMQGVNPDPSAAQAQLLTAKLSTKDLAELKSLFVRPGFVHEWETQDERAKEVAKRLTSKEASTPSAAWKLLTSVDPEAVLWLALTSKSAPVQAKLKDFFTVWPEARQRIPYALMQEMRITPELEGYQDLLKSIFFELIDGRLTTDEELRQFLEPYSPPAPPPPVSIRRTRGKKSAEKSREVREIDDDELEARPERDPDDEDENEDTEDTEDQDSDRDEPIRRAPSPVAPPPSAPVAAPAPKPALVVAPAPTAVKEPISAKPSKEKSTPAKEELPAKVAAHPPTGPKLASKAVPVPAPKHAPVAAKPVAKTAAKSASKHSPAKPVAKTAPAPKKSIAVPVKSKTAAKPAPKKPAAKTPVKSKAHPVIAKKTAKPFGKAKPAASQGKAATKPAVKSKTAVKSAASSAATKKAAVKTSPSKKAPAKAVLHKKKR